MSLIAYRVFEMFDQSSIVLKFATEIIIREI